MGGKSGVALGIRDDLHRLARSRFRLRGHADGAAQTARADGDGLSAGQIDVVRHALYCVVGDLGRARNIEDTALVIPHGSLHIYTAALVAGRVVADLTAVHVDGSAVIHAAAKSSTVAGDLAAVHIEFTELANAYASVGVAGDGAAKHIQRAEAEYIYAAVAAAFDRTAAYAVGQGQMRFVIAKDPNHIVDAPSFVCTINGVSV